MKQQPRGLTQLVDDIIVFVAEGDLMNARKALDDLRGVLDTIENPPKKKARGR